MKIALSVFKDSISTVFDAADQLLIVEIDEVNGQKRKPAKLSAANIAGRVSQLKEKGIDVLICGAISRPMQAAIVSAGIIVCPFVRGSAEALITAYLNGNLEKPLYALPGCHGRGRGLKRGRATGGRCRRRSA